MRSERGLRRVAVLLGTCLALLAGTSRVASAHTVLLRSTPAAGSRLAASPSRVTLVFSEPLEAGMASMALVHADGTSITLAVAADPHDVHALVAPIDGTLAPGAYRVTYHVVSADGHAVRGSIVFTVTPSPATRDSVPRAVVAPASAPPFAAPPDDAGDTSWGPSVAGAPVLPALLRGLALGALMLLAGLLWFIAGPGASPEAAPRRAARVADWLAIASLVLLAAHALAWAVNVAPEHQLTDATMGAALTSETGRTELWRTGLALLALWALVLARRPRLALLFSAAALLASGLAGHSAVLHPLWAAPAKALHLLAGGAWLGGVLWLLLCARDDEAAYLREAERVSAVAIASVVIVAFSGLLQAVLFLPTPLDVVRTAYGALVLAKLAALLVLVAFGAHHRSRGIPRLASNGASVPRFAATLRAELAVMALAVLLGGLLAYVPPDARAAAGPSSSSTIQ